MDHSSILPGETSQDNLESEVVTETLDKVPGKVDDIPVSNAASIANKKRNEYEEIMPQNDTNSENQDPNESLKVPEPNEKSRQQIRMEAEDNVSNQDTNQAEKVPDPNQKSRLQIRMEFENEGYIVRKKEEIETENVDNESEVVDDHQETESRTTGETRVVVGAWMILISWVLFEMKG